MNFLVVGCGSIGKRHLRNSLALAKSNDNAGKVFAYDSNPEVAAAVANELGVACLPNLDAAAEEKIAGAVVAIPNSLHVPTARRLMEQGVSVMIEKPLSHTLDGVDELIELGRKKKLVLLTGYNLRYHPNLLSAKQKLEEGLIGRVLSARVHFGYNLALWRPHVDYRKNYGAIKAQGGGVILDVIHEINVITWLFGDVAQVACMASKRTDLEIDTEDVASAVLRMKSGAIVQLYLDYADLAYDRGLRVVGDKGSLTWDMPSATLKTYDPVSKTWAEEKAQFDFNETYLGELKHFMDAIRGEVRPSDDGSIARLDLRIALACKESAETGRFVTL